MEVSAFDIMSIANDISIQKPHLIIIAGPNGAGRYITALVLFKGTLKVAKFVNADTIAQGLSAFWP